MDNKKWKEIKNHFDEIYEWERWDNYWEISGSYCGDMIRMRFYDDGMVCER